MGWLIGGPIMMALGGLCLIFNLILGLATGRASSWFLLASVIFVIYVLNS